MAIVLLIILYTLVCIVLIDRLSSKSKIRLTRKEIAFAFCFKVSLGILYGFIFKKFYGGDDTWRLFDDSLNEYNKLFFQTGQFFKEFIPLDSFQKYPDFSSCFRDFVENLENNAIIKSLAFFNVLSFQNYYVDVVFFNLFSFFGTYLLFKLFSSIFPFKRFTVYEVAFFVPSIAFWLSGIRGDAVLLFSVALALYYFYNWTIRRRTIDVLLFLLGLVGIFIFRNQFFFVILPFFFAWWLTNAFKWNPVIVFGSVLIFSIVVFFSSGAFSARVNLPLIVANKQHEFLLLKGNTEFAINPLEPNIKSYASTLPQAFVNSSFRPYPWEAKGPLQWAASAEIIFFWLVFLVAVFQLKRVLSIPFTSFILLFSLCIYLLIGFTVPFPGAIVRYKIIPELLLFLLLIPLLPFKLKKITI